jgi:DNA-directed RNA polymerase subunit K/omega
MNKYEMVIIAAREARRLNDVARSYGRDLKRRPTILAWERLHQGKIKYTWEEPAPEAPATPELPFEEAADSEA